MATTTQESQAAVTALSAPHLSAVASRARAAEADIGALEQSHRDGQVTFGMAAGLALLVGGLFTLGVLTNASFGTQPLLYAPLAAGLGAFVSVLARMTRGQLLLSYESGRTIMRLLGLIRPLLGGLLGAAVYVVLAGGLLTIEPPAGKPQLFFYIGIAFISGFSERFAQDMVARAPAATAAPAAAPAAGAAVAAVAPVHPPG